MLDALQFEFMRNALLAGILASVISGVIGTLVVVNRIVFLAGSIAHAAYGGRGICPNKRRACEYSIFTSGARIIMVTGTGFFISLLLERIMANRFVQRSRQARD